MPTPNPSPSTRFLPGCLVGDDDRFRIISLLGKGGMGEVYRADDLKLGERVALKFLPEAREGDEIWLRRFRQEIRIARNVAHPHVCRVHDVGEHDGALFLTMECIEGEDLWRLLQRFGRDADGNPMMPLPGHKALDLAYQLCAGVAAIHDRDILHRDLKPANVIIDDRGLAKITDFGLSGWVGQNLHADEGTWPYMAPEQLEGRGVTERSDVYSLGLVLYELFTGKRAFEGRSRQGLVPPASVNPSLDPEIGQAILHCLEPEPERRPASARKLAEELPEPEAAPDPNPCPPPELLLLPDPEDKLRPRAAWAALGALAAGLLLVTSLAGATHLPRFLDSAATPQVLAARARETAAQLGYPEPPDDAVYGFSYQPERLTALDRLDLPPGRRAELAAGAMSPVSFWYRASPAPLAPYNRNALRSYDDPPATEPGTVGVQLDPRGRLRRFEALPYQTVGDPVPGDPALAVTSSRESDWAPLIAAAGLPLAALHPTRPTLAPSRFADRRAAWEGTYPELEGTGVRIEVAAHGAAPVSARVLGPESEEAGAGPSPLGRVVRRLSQTVLGLWFVAVLAGAVCYARRNFRRKCADRSAAILLAVYFICARLAVWLFGTHHTLGRQELETLWSHFAEATFGGGLAWILYTALEPLLRRDWPRQMASWVRLMHGRVRDPRVGRDVLFGASFGVLALLLGQLCLLIPAWLGPRLPDPTDLTVGVMVKQSLLELQLEALRGLPNAVAAALHAHAEAMLIAFFGIFGYFQLRFLVHRAWPAVLAAALLIWILMVNPTASHTGLSLLAAGLYCGLWLAVLLRVGFLPAMLAAAVVGMLRTVPLTLDFGAWYAPGGVGALLLVLGIGVYGFVVSLGGEAAVPKPALAERTTAKGDPGGEAAESAMGTSEA